MTKKEIISEEFVPEEEVGLEPVVEEQKISDVSVGIPEAEFVFNSYQALLWAKDFKARVQNAWRSVRFEPDGMLPELVKKVLRLASLAVMGEYRPVSFLPGVERGVFYVPESLADEECLSWMERGETVGGYVVFRRP